MPEALYYPWIDIKDEVWLKSSLLYWDSIRTIVPESIDSPYSTNTGLALQDARFLVPLRIHSGMEEIEELTNDVLTYLRTEEGAELLMSTDGGHRCDIHVEKLQFEFGMLANIHPEKLPYVIRDILSNLTEPSRRGRDWLNVNEKFADFYMTLLASRLSERVGARLLTSLAPADRLAIAARLDAQLNGVIPMGLRTQSRHWREYEAFGPRRRIPRHLAPGMLAHLAIERIGVAPDTPVERLIEFRERHRDELAQFRTKVEQLAACIEVDLTAESLRKHVMDIYTGEVAPAISNLKAALEGQRIKWLGDGLMKIAFMSVSTVLVNAGLNVPTALLSGAGISLIGTRVMHNVDKKESLRANPYTYLLSIKRELA
jgi:hypothetical protein